MRSMMRPRYPVAKDCFPTTSTWYSLPSQVHSVRELFLPFPICQISSRGVFKRKLFAAKKQVSHEFRSHVHGKKLPKFKANPQRLSLNKEDSIWFLHFLFVQIEFLHAHVTQDPFPMSSIVLWLTDSTKPALLIKALWTRIYIIFIIYINGTKIGTFSWKNTAVLLDYVNMRGGRALPKFFVTFWRGAFLVNKGAYFFQNANNLN